jgi:hypothetical protein
MRTRELARGRELVRSVPRTEHYLIVPKGHCLANSEEQSSTRHCIVFSYDSIVADKNG